MQLTQRDYYESRGRVYNFMLPKGYLLTEFELTTNINPTFVEFVYGYLTFAQGIQDSSSKRWNFGMKLPSLDFSQGIIRISTKEKSDKISIIVFGNTYVLNEKLDLSLYSDGSLTLKEVDKDQFVVKLGKYRILPFSSGELTEKEMKLSQKYGISLTGGLCGLINDPEFKVSHNNINKIN
jgi:hypothetical protein